MSEYLENALVILSEMAEAKKMKGKDPCWDGYEMVGTKKKNGKEVPNCVPKNEEVELEEAQLAHKVMYAMKDPKKGGKIAVAHYEKEEDAKKFLDDIKKKGGHGIIRKNEPKNEEVDLDEAKGALTYTPKATKYAVIPDGKKQFVKQFDKKEDAEAHAQKHGGKVKPVDQAGRTMKEESEIDLNQLFTEAMKKDEESSKKKVINKGEQLSGKQEVVKVHPEIPNKN